MWGVCFVGEGTGVLNIQCGVPERMISSEIYETLDTLFYQNSNLATWGKSSNVSFTDYVASNSSSNHGYLAPSLNGTATDSRKWNTDLCIEFEFVKGTGNMQIQINDGTHNVTRYLTEDCTVRIECKSNGTYFIFNGRTPITQDALTGTFLLRFIVWANSSNTIKNMKIYSI